MAHECGDKTRAELARELLDATTALAQAFQQPAREPLLVAAARYDAAMEALTQAPALDTIQAAVIRAFDAEDRFAALYARLMAPSVVIDAADRQWFTDVANEAIAARRMVCQLLAGALQRQHR